MGKKNAISSVLTLSNEEARQFFLSQRCYSNIQLPEYFVFSALLEELSRYKELVATSLKKAKNNENVNYKFLINKDGKYAWRPLQLINPAIYVYLVNLITGKESWEIITGRFREFQADSRIECHSIPVFEEASDTKEKKQHPTATIIMNWWQQIEQRSLELSLEYDFCFHTDLTDCYGSIYTHTISWALYGKEKAKEEFIHKPQQRRNKDVELGEKIDTALQSMNYAQTNGIPQGSVLMEFIAEIILGYADNQLSLALKNEEEVFKILRYRDDYRIFTKNQDTAKRIARVLTSILIELNFRINSQKTILSENLIRDSIKPDKLYWLETSYKKQSPPQKILSIHLLSEKFPNSGSLKRALSDFQRQIYQKKYKPNTIGEVKVMISIITDIAYRNPNSYPMAMAILSKLLSLLEDDEMLSTVQAIQSKFKSLLNVGHFEIWLQRMVLNINRGIPFSDKLCQLVSKGIQNDSYGEDIKKIWNIDWLAPKIKQVFSEQPIIDENLISKIPNIIDPDEVRIFDYF